MLHFLGINQVLSSFIEWKAKISTFNVGALMYEPYMLENAFK